MLMHYEQGYKLTEFTIIVGSTGFKFALSRANKQCCHPGHFDPI